jgi:hypothetical protein
MDHRETGLAYHWLLEQVQTRVHITAQGIQQHVYAIVPA